MLYDDEINDIIDTHTAIELLRGLPRDSNCTLNDPRVVEACADVEGTQCNWIQRIVERLEDARHACINRAFPLK